MFKVVPIIVKSPTTSVIVLLFSYKLFRLFTKKMNSKEKSPAKFQIQKDQSDSA